MDTYSEANPTAVSAKLTFVVRGFAYAALMLSVWDWITTLSFESLVIWRKSADYRIRWLYCTSRYLGLLAQLANSFVVGFIQFSRFSTEQHCRVWFGLQLLISGALLLSLEIILVLRIHALYSRNSRLTWALVIGLVIETVVATACGGSAIRELTFSNDGGCLPMHAPTTVVYMSATQLVTQLVIWSLTLYKHLSTHLELGWTKIPILSLVTRDGFWVFALLATLLAAMIADASRRQFGNHATLLCYFAFPVYVAIVSLSSCRITMNIQTFSSEPPIQPSFETPTHSIELTTVFTSFE
ncbi:hypothetical protein B0H34DRAFT_356123 [Crassisporium funariophilum]|nr:hypothetical protein B0H34DRAFT_356123 [Crassisporium funariophilum]